MNTTKHCPGFEPFKSLKSFLCKCLECATEQEIFSDEFNQKRNCKKCHQPIDFKQCHLDGGIAESQEKFNDN